MSDINVFLNNLKDTELYKILVNIENREDFLLYCLDTLETEEKRQKLLNYIKEYDITDSGDVLELVDCIEEGVEPEFDDE